MESRTSMGDVSARTARHEARSASGSVQRLVLIVALSALSALAGCARKPKQHNLVLIVIDTLRADHLSCYGYERETSPSIDALAADGLRFTHVQAPRAKTTPSVASLMTGLYPQDHGIRDLTMALGARATTLAQDFQRAGYSTSAIVGNYVLQKQLSGLDRGFQNWIEDFPQTQGLPPNAVPQRTARSLTDGALELMGWDSVTAGETPQAEEAQPFFLYLHYMDPHGLYEPPLEHRIFEGGEARAIPDAAQEVLGPHASHFKTRIATDNVPQDAFLPDGQVDAALVVARYDSEIRFVDHEIGRLLEAMRSAGKLDDSWVVIVADHGESLGEHRYWFEHGIYAYEATCRVPLIIFPPLGLEQRPAPGVRNSDLCLADLRPTLLSWLKLRGRTLRIRGPQGISRAELLEGEAKGQHPVFCEKVDRSERSRAVQSKAVRLGDYKLIRRFIPTKEAQQFRVLEELYELGSDPAEEHNLLTLDDLDSEVPYSALSSALEAFVEADEDFADLSRILNSKREALLRNDPEALRVLEALGY